MFQFCEYNTKEKMMKCYADLLKDPQRHAYTFFIVSPQELVGKYWVYYLPRR
jgi:hypothetical protein